MKDCTHDISLIDYHVKDVETLGKVLNNAAAAAFPRSGSSRYCDVYVLLLSWEDDDLGAVREIDDLEAVFRDLYGYRVGSWKIPSTTSHNSLVYRIMQALRDFESSDKLFITYYGGHGFMNDDRQCVWLCNQRPGAATLQWSSIQTMLEEAECDVLVLLDCCAAASSGGSHGKGVTELIAACGFEAFAPGVGEHSFSRSLIEELKYLSQRCDSVTTALLHNKVLARIKKSWNPRYSSNGSQERRRTPIHIHLSDDTKQRCIKLAPLRPLTACTPSSNSLHASSSGSSDPSTSASEDVDMIGSDETSQSSLSEVWPDKKFESPKVLISVALQEDQRLNAEDWLEWLKSVPALANLVQVEGVFKSDSTLLILTLPVALWDSIPRDPAVTFLAFVRSHNLCNPSHQHSQGISTAVFHNTLCTEGETYPTIPTRSLFPPQAGYNLDNIPNYAQGNIPDLGRLFSTQGASSEWGPSLTSKSDGSGYASGLYPYYSTKHHPLGLPGAYGPDYYNQRPDFQDPSVYNQPIDSQVVYNLSTDSVRLHQSQSPTIPPQAGAAVEQSTNRPQVLPFHCVFPGCAKQFAHTYALDRHMKVHFPNSVSKLDCPQGAKGSFCKRVGERGFTRKDHLDEHLRKVHLIDLPKSVR